MFKKLCNTKLNPIDFFPFGMLMPGRHENSAQYRFGFNGKEKDDEISGNGNSYDFGARIYDPRVGRWLSLDPMATNFTSESPYIFAGSNPIFYLDGDGRFKIPIHSEITRKSLENTTLKLADASKVDIVFGNTFMADIVGGFSDYHFDGRGDFNQIQETWKDVNNKLQNITFGDWNKTYGGADAISLGRQLHTVQDFYAHSNYVELYIEYYKNTNNGEIPTEVPIFEDGVKIGGFKDLMERTTFDENGKYQGLHTGEFDLKDNEFWDVDPTGDNSTGPNSHKQMNKDKADTPEGKLAKDAAVKHTTKILDNLNNGG